VNFSRIEPAYTTKDGCRLVWQGIDEDDTDTIILNKKELESTIEILQKNSTGTIELEDQMSVILINSDTIQFNLKDHKPLEVPTFEFQKKILEYAKIPHNPQYIYMSSKEFYPSVWIRKNDSEKREFQDKGNTKQSLLQTIFSATPQIIDHSDLFRVMSTRRSTRKFDKTKVEDWKIDKILAAADTAPTAGNFQGFEVFYIQNQKIKEALVESANKQPYVNAPVVLVFCMDPSRIKLKFPANILDKFSLQDATLAAAYSQLAASGVGLSSIWIGMFDEEKVKLLLGTNLRPSSILCIGYPDKKRPPKSRRNLKDLIKIIE
jgi:nitroreductase